MCVQEGEGGVARKKVKVLHTHTLTHARTNTHQVYFCAKRLITLEFFFQTRSAKLRSTWSPPIAGDEAEIKAHHIHLRMHSHMHARTRAHQHAHTHADTQMHPSNRDRDRDTNTDTDVDTDIKTDTNVDIESVGTRCSVLHVV